MIPQYSGFKTKDEYLARIFGSDGVPKNTSVGASKMLENVGRGLVSLQPPPSYIDLGHVILDIASIEPKTPDDAIRYWTERGRVMAALSDYYWATKQIMYNREHGCETDLDRKLLQSIQNDFQDHRICCDDRLVYGSGLDVQVIQHFGSKNALLRQETDLEIGEYMCADFYTVLDDPEILRLMQFLCRTNDCKDDIIKTLEVLGNRTRDKLYFWTARVSDRVSDPNKAVFLNYDIGGFRIGCGCNMGRLGRSRGVRYEKKVSVN